MVEFFLGLLLSIVLSLAFFYGFPLLGIVLAYWICLIMALVLVYGGWFVLIDGDI